ncbi:hemerythrin domain-containing protein [Oryzobacter terrae]|uniref:hemerythrin domain-containing protein n=1 Tax=Oryzobacter terrae TaxID=1620385 RepID=UPI003672CB9A
MTGEDDASRPVRTAAAARVVAMGSELRRLHDRIRDVLDDALDAAREGSSDDGADVARLRAAAATITDDLVTRCRAFCALLTGHHEAEDARLFPWLLRERPDLALVVERLEQDHAMIGTLLAGLADALERGAAGGVLVGHLEGLDAILESHVRYEERELVAVLDALGPATPGPALDDRFWRAGMRG